MFFCWKYCQIRAVVSPGHLTKTHNWLSLSKFKGEYCNKFDGRSWLGPARIVLHMHYIPCGVLLWLYTLWSLCIFGVLSKRLPSTDATMGFCHCALLHLQLFHLWQRHDVGWTWLSFLHWQWVQHQPTIGFSSSTCGTIVLWGVTLQIVPCLLLSILFVARFLRDGLIGLRRWNFTQDLLVFDLSNVII